MNFRELKSFLMDFFGTAVAAGNIGAMDGLSKVQNASNIDELISLAESYGIDIDRYIEDEER